MKGIIAEINKKYAIVLTQDGTFKRIKVKSGMAVGAEVDLDQPSNSVISVKLIAKVSSVAAAVLLALGTGLCAYSYTVPYSYVDIDINPSIEITANVFDRIIKTEALNDDGRILLDSERLKNVKLEEGLALLLNKAHGQGYLKSEDVSENTVLMTVTSKDDKKSEKLRQEVEKTTISELEKKKINSEVLIAEASINEKAEAKKLGVTPGKLVLIEDAAEEEPEMKFDELKDTPVNELVKRVRDKKAEKEPKKEAEKEAKKEAAESIKEEREKQKEEKKKEKEEGKKEENKDRKEEKEVKNNNTAKSTGGIAVGAVKNIIDSLKNMDNKDGKDKNNNINKNNSNRNSDSGETEKKKEEKQREEEKQRLRDELLGLIKGNETKKSGETKPESTVKNQNNNKNKEANSQDNINKSIDSGKKNTDSNDKKQEDSKERNKADNGSKKESSNSDKNGNNNNRDNSKKSENNNNSNKKDNGNNNDKSGNSNKSNNGNKSNNSNNSNNRDSRNKK